MRVSADVFDSAILSSLSFDILFTPRSHAAVRRCLLEKRLGAIIVHHQRSCDGNKKKHGCFPPPREATAILLPPRVSVTIVGVTIKRAPSASASEKGNGCGNSSDSREQREAKAAMHGRILAIELTPRRRLRVFSRILLANPKSSWTPRVELP